MKGNNWILGIASALALQSVGANAAPVVIEIAGRYESAADILNNVQHIFSTRLAYDTSGWAYNNSQGSLESMNAPLDLSMYGVAFITAGDDYVGRRKKPAALRS